MWSHNPGFEAASAGPVADTPLGLVGLTALMARSSGRADIGVGLIDGPVALGHPALAAELVREVPAGPPPGCRDTAGASCRHGTFVAGILAGRRGSQVPGICPDCTLLVRPVFGETEPGPGLMPTATPEELAEALLATVESGARVVNVSADLRWSSVRERNALTEALDHALRRGVIVVAAAGNQGAVGGSALTRHPAVLPVAACDVRGRPLGYSNLGASIGRHGVRAPGEGVAGLTTGRPDPISGTSVAAPLVTGTVALLWSLRPAAGAAAVRDAVLNAAPWHRAVVPPLLDAWGAYLRVTAGNP
ncbi:S8 family serine peptidase [Kitasatospora misakiensis]|uniref:S8 family serine peptidase n=1 Tax=Kitasatospora misakiensis TaxID=67330 RepID=A0ABW0XB47_9ACTN